MHPQLAKTYGPKFNRFPCYCQPKLNGVRALYQNGVFQSRGQHGQDGKIWHEHVLQHLRPTMQTLEMSGFSGIFDCELYTHGWKLQRINGAVATNRTQPRDDTHLVQLHIFDFIPNSFDVPFSRRWLGGLYQTIQEMNSDCIKAVPTALCGSRSDVDLHFHHYTSLGYEGIMLRPDGPYVPGRHISQRTGTETEKRSDFLWKHKAWQYEQFLCVGTTPGQGKAAIGIGALVCVHEYQHLDGRNEQVEFEVGTGYDDDQRAEFKRNPPIGRKVNVKFLEYTADGRPFNASFEGIL